MNTRARRRVALLGTFDVANFGDLLFPLIARRELSLRLDEVEVVPFSYHAKASSTWPFEVFPLERFMEELPTFSAVVIGGGHLIRFDKEVAPGYRPPRIAIHHPTGYWLAPALAAISAGVPVAWNAPSASPKTPRWARPMLRLALEQSAYVAVRDAPSLEELRKVTSMAVIDFVPDTVFGLRSLFEADEGRLPIPRRPRPYLLLQATDTLDAVLQGIRGRAHERGFDLVEVPFGPALGDQVGHLEGAGESAVAGWGHPFEVAGWIAGSSGVLARSLHASIAGLVFGKPVLAPSLPGGTKYASLVASPRVFAADEPGGVDRFLSAGTLSEPDAFVDERVRALAGHWDRIAEVIRRGAPPKSRPAFAAFVFGLPGLLEERAEMLQNTAMLRNQVAESRTRIAHLEQDLSTREKEAARQVLNPPGRWSLSRLKAFLLKLAG